MSRKLARIVCWVVLAAAVAAGLYARFHALGIRPLAVDEYYFVRSVGFILDTGLPRFPSGGYYVRGALPQYVTAAFCLAFGHDGLAWRLFPALCSLGSVVLVYVYGRRHVGSLPAAAVAVALLVSSWEIEFARFARMYAPFQCATLAFLVAAERAFVDRRKAWSWVPHLVCIVAALTHEMAVLLAPLLLLPLLDRDSAPRRGGPLATGWFAAAGVATTLVCGAVQQLKLRNLGVVDRYPEGFVPRARPPLLRIPELPFEGIGPQGVWYVGLAAAAIVVATIVVVYGRRRATPIDEAGVLAAVSVAAAAFHALSIVAVCTALLVQRCRIHRPALHARRTYWLLLAALLLAAGWVVELWRASPTLGVGVPGGRSLAGAAAAVLFGWPDFYGPLLGPWLDELPVLTVLAAIAVAIVLQARDAWPWGALLRSPLLVLAWIALSVALLQSFYRSTRYTFFVYPLVLVVIALGAVIALRGLAARVGRPDAPLAGAAAALFLALFLAAGDFSPAHIAGVADDEASLRIGRFAGRDRTWYPRHDVRSPAEFVNRAADPGDAIVVDSQAPVSHYLEGEHAILYDREDTRFAHVSRQRGTLEVWSNRRLLGTAEELRRYAAGGRVVWLVRSVKPTQRSQAVETALAAPGVRASREALGVDGRIEVLRVLGLGAPPPPGAPGSGREPV